MTDYDSDPDDEDYRPTSLREAYGSDDDGDDAPTSGRKGKRGRKRKQAAPPRSSFVPAASTSVASLPSLTSMGCYVISPVVRTPGGYVTAGKVDKQEEKTGGVEKKILLENGMCQLWRDETLNSVQQRQAAFQSISSHVQNKISSIISAHSTSVLDNLYSFLNSVYPTTAHPTLTPTYLAFAGSDSLLPLALMLVGMNMADHTTLFAQLDKDLQERPWQGTIPFIVPLTVQSTTTTSTLLKSLVTDLQTFYPPHRRHTFRTTNRGTHILAELERQEEREKKQKKDTMTQWKEWWAKQKERVEKEYRETPNKKEEKKENKKGTKAASSAVSDSTDFPAHIYPPIYLLLPTFDTLSSSLLQSFFYLLTQDVWVRTLKIVLIVGVARGGQIINELLPNAITSHFFTSTFNLAPSTATFTTLIQDVLKPGVAQMGVAISGSGLKMIEEYFDSQNTSLSALTHALNALLLCHFDSTPASQLCQLSLLTAEERKDVTIEPCVLDYVRKLESVTKHFKGLSSDRRSSVPKSNSDLHTEILRFLTALAAHQAQFATSFELLYATRDRLVAKKLMSKQELYYQVLDEPVEDIEELQPLFQALAKLDKTDLIKRMQSWEQFLEANQHVSPGYSRLLSTLGELFDSTSAVSAPSSVPVPKSRQSQSLTAAQRRDALFAVANKSKDTAGQLNDRVVKWFKGFCRTNLMPITSLPMHEVVTSHAAEELQYLLQAAPRAAINTALTNSAYYLPEDEKQEIDLRKRPQRKVKEDLSPMLEDICIAYQLYLESGRTINLYDWYQAFASTHIVTFDKQPKKKQKGNNTGASGSKKNKQDKEEEKEENGDKPIYLDSEENLQARFMTCTSVLHSLGYIKPTGRKVDHVAKTTFHAD